MNRAARKRFHRTAALGVLIVLIVLIGLVGAAASATPRMVAAGWQGTWKTNWGQLTVTQTGAGITGTYTHKQGRIVGLVTGSVVTGTWSQMPTYRGSRDTGRFTFQLGPSGTTFTGTWTYGTSSVTRGTWHGTLAGAPTWNGTWSTNWGTMTLTQTGDHVTGVYTHDSGKIDATASGLTLTGTWSESPTYAGPTDAGPFVLHLDANGASFTGQWAYVGRPLGGSWSGTHTQT